jgi:hypothetical protein
MESIIADRILAMNLLFSAVVFFIVARMYIIPYLHRLSDRVLIQPILLFHSLRHLGLMFLAPGAVISGMPSAFAIPAAIGDLITAFLALIALLAVRRQSPNHTIFLWIFNVFGTFDLVYAVTTGTINNIGPFMGASYWIPSFWVPMLLVTHYIVFLRLLTKNRKIRDSSKYPNKYKLENCWMSRR